MDTNSMQVQVPGLSLATVEGTSEGGRPIVEWAGGGEPCVAEVVWMRPAPDWAACVGLRVLVGFEDGNVDRPMVVGLLDAPPEGAFSDAPAAGTPAPVPTGPVPTGRGANGDGRSAPDVLRLSGEREVVLECGKAKISLRADGRILIRGGHLISRSSGPNKIRGASVFIN